MFCVTACPCVSTSVPVTYVWAFGCILFSDSRTEEKLSDPAFAHAAVEVLEKRGPPPLPPPPQRLLSSLPLPPPPYPPPGHETRRGLPGFSEWAKLSHLVPCEGLWKGRYLLRRRQERPCLMRTRLFHPSCDFFSFLHWPRSRHWNKGFGPWNVNLDGDELNLVSSLQKIARFYQ